MKKLLLPVLLLALSGCDLGSGSKLETLEIVNASGFSITQPPYRMYECFRDRLNVIGRFTNGDAGNFSTRVIWTSSDPTIVRVLNNNEQVTRGVVLGKFDNISGLFYSAGVLVPKGPGNATITASFLGLSTSVMVTVLKPTLTIERSPIGSAGSNATGVGFLNQFTVRTVLDKGQVIDAALLRQDPATVEPLNPILWQFTPNNTFSAGNSASTASLDREDLNLFPMGSTRTTTDPAVTGNEIATLNPFSGVLRAVRAGAQNPTIQAQFDTEPMLGVFCPTQPPAVAVPIATVNSLAVSPEAGFNNDLVVSTDENLVTIADLGSGMTQDVSNQVGYEVDSTNRDACVGTADCMQAANRTSSIFTFTGNQMTTVPGTDGSFCDSRTAIGQSGVPAFNCDTSVDAVNIHACAPNCTLPTMFSPNVAFRAVPATLTSYDAVTPASVTQVAFTFPGQQFSVLANFTSATNSFSGGLATAKQNITRYIGWLPRPAGSTTGVSDLVRLIGLTGTVNGQTYYQRNPDAPTTLDITATPATSTRIGAFANASTLPVPAPATLTIIPR